MRRLRPVHEKGRSALPERPFRLVQPPSWISAIGAAWVRRLTFHSST